MSGKAGEENEIYGYLRHSHEEKGVLLNGCAGPWADSKR